LPDRILLSFDPMRPGGCDEVCRIQQVGAGYERLRDHSDGDAGDANYSAGGPLAGRWAGMPKNRRPTCLIGNDQIMVGVLKEIIRLGYKCPEDLGLISTVESALCEYSNPALTSLDISLGKLGEMAAILLIDHLEEGTVLSPEMSQNNFPASFLIRESCGFRRKESRG
jgi:DNA-binding LacI/PurR family transcriptional regulator